ncbi:hypothetical protein FOA52_002874 [Chlamydomonas sp. UWO 241]|nr:hypothetical protein FOA52_002874 [Chlamydomonas sp. UWO 241]
MMEVDPLPGTSYTWLNVGTLRKDPRVGCVELNRPDKANAFNTGLWDEFPRAIDAMDAAASTLGLRAVLVTGAGPNFCAGIDLQYLKDMFQALKQERCPGRMREQFRRHILGMQACFSVLEACRLPVIAAVHGCCVGGGIDLITACDVRVCSEGATFCVKEVDVGIVADLGTLQRLPRIVGFGLAQDLALTARTIGAERALQIGLVTEVVPGGRDALLQAACRFASALASKPPLALVGTKRVLLHARDSAAVRDGLDYVATWNSAQLMSDDVAQVVGVMGGRGKPRAPVFAKLASKL